MGSKDAEAEGREGQQCTDVETIEKPEEDPQAEEPHGVPSRSPDGIVVVTDTSTNTNEAANKCKTLILQSSLESTTRQDLGPKGDQLDRLKEKKIEALKTSLSRQEAELALLQAKLEGLSGKTKNPPSQTVKTHITLLHTYNDIRDIGQGLIGMVVEQRNANYNRGSSTSGSSATGTGNGNMGTLRLGDVYAEFGLGIDD